MEIGFLTYKNYIEQEVAKRAKTDKRIIQRQIRQDQLNELQQNKIQLLDFDQNLKKLNPHSYQNQEYVNHRILQLQIANNLKQEEELDKFQQYIQLKSDKEYLNDVQMLDKGLDLAKNKYLLGKQRQEITNKQQQKQFIKKYDFGLLKSAIKQSDQPIQENEQTLSQASRKTQRLKSILKERTSIIITQLPLDKIEPIAIDNNNNNNNNTNNNVDDDDDDDDQNHIQFLNVFKKDTTLKKENVEELIPNYENIEQKQQKRKNQQEIRSQNQVSSNLMPKQQKVQFNELAEHITYHNDEYFAQEGSIFRDMDQLTFSLHNTQHEGKVIQKELPKIIHDDQYTWSQNIIQYYMNEKEQEKKKQQEPQLTDRDIIEEMPDFKSDYLRSRYNDIYSTTTKKKDFAYYIHADQQESIKQSMRSLQNLKVHQYRTDKDLQIEFPKYTPSQIEDQQYQHQTFQEKYFDKDLQQQDILSQFQSEQSSINRQADKVGQSIEEGKELLERQFNSHQYTNEKLVPNFNGVQKLEAIHTQFTKIPEKKAPFTQQNKEIFSQFYKNIQEPLDILHQQTGTYEQAKKIEQKNLEEQMRQKSKFEVGSLPKPMFFANQYSTTQQNGNQHIKLIQTDHEQMSRRVKQYEANKHYEY